MPPSSPAPRFRAARAQVKRREETESGMFSLSLPEATASTLLTVSVVLMEESEMLSLPAFTRVLV